VLGIGENIIFIYKGHLEWQGNKDQVADSTNKRLNDLVFASELSRKLKAMVENEKEREQAE
jgi:phospholipid/cholesterol/gamma-HCH transport system ATP-binding protein